MKRCDWVGDNPLMIKYHDEEWGVPLHNDKKLFEFLILDSFQAGLSWQIILNKRKAFRTAFDNFNAEIISQYKEDKITELLQNKSIIRNKLKIRAAVNNAKKFLEIQKEFDSFEKYIWQFTNGKTIQNGWKTIAEIPATSPESDAMSKNMKKRGFKFVGSTICYAFMQASGMVNDHLVSCFRYEEININELVKSHKKYKTVILSGDER